MRGRASCKRESRAFFSVKVLYAGVRDLCETPCFLDLTERKLRQTPANVNKRVSLIMQRGNLSCQLWTLTDGLLETLKAYQQKPSRS